MVVISGNSLQAGGTVAVRDEGIPSELRERHQWVAWKLVHREGQTKPTKVPYIAPKVQVKASTTDRSTWGSFQDVISAFQAGLCDGIGFVFSESDPFVGVDLDGCRDPETGMLEQWAEEIIEFLGSYTDASPSGTGVHIILEGKLPSGRRRKGQIEMYSEGRFFTMTGEGLPQCPQSIEQRAPELLQLHSRVFNEEEKQVKSSPVTRHQENSGVLDDDNLINKASQALNGEKFRALWSGDWHSYDSESEATLALCNLLAFWTEGDPQQMDRMFRRSGLMRPKWDEPRGRETWGKQQIKVALYATHVPIVREDGGPEEGNLRLTDTWNARRLVEHNNGDLLWCEVFKCWYVYDGTRFIKDSTREVERRAEATVKAFYEYAGGYDDRSKRQELAEWAVKSESRYRIYNMVESAKRMVPVVPNEFDTDPLLFNVLNGTIDLRTNQIRPHNRVDRLLKRADVVYDPRATSPLWLEFLQHIFQGNESVIGFVQRLFGYCLTGLVTEHIIVILYGTGANGKSTMVTTLRRLMGDYAYHARPEVFMAKHNDTQGFELVPLASARVVTAAEIGGGKRLDEALVKEMTGGEPITCAPKYGDFFTFQPSFKPLLVTNNKPEIKGVDEGIWRRLVLVPFTVTIPREMRDLDLSNKLEKELPGILNWALGGLERYRSEGLNPPQEVLTAIDQYRAEQDILGAWIEDRCELDPDLSGEYGVLYEDYCSWCESNKEQPLKKSFFSSSLDQRGCVSHRAGKGKRTRIGISLRSTQGVTR